MTMDLAQMWWLIGMCTGFMLVGVWIGWERWGKWLRSPLPALPEPYGVSSPAEDDESATDFAWWTRKQLIEHGEACAAAVGWRRSNEEVSRQGGEKR